MQVLARSSTSARPRVASPEAPVSDAGMPSPTTAYDANVCAWAAQGRARAAAMSHARRLTGLAKAIHRDGLVPLPSIIGFACARLARRIDRACATAFSLDENVVLRLIDAGERECITRRHRVVADAGQSRRVGWLARDQVHDHGGAGLALRARGRRRFRNA